MNNAIKIILTLAVLIVIGILIFREKTVPPVQNTDGTVVMNEDSITGCYIATLGKDVYTLTVLNQTDGVISGTLAFKNFEKDSSSGTFNGTYSDGILLGNYAFQSEGMSSIMQVIFKKTDNGFVRGYGDVDATGTKFTNLSAITYDTSAVFVKTEANCFQ